MAFNDCFVSFKLSWGYIGFFFLRLNRIFNLNCTANTIWSMLMRPILNTVESIYWQQLVFGVWLLLAIQQRPNFKVSHFFRYKFQHFLKPILFLRSYRIERFGWEAIGSKCSSSINTIAKRTKSSCIMLWSFIANR